MASAVDICNIALAHLGDAATVTSINPPDGSAQADHCARFYPIAKDMLLSRQPWSFTLGTATLAQLDTEIPGYAYVYALPADCVRVQRVMPPDTGIQDKLPWIHFSVLTVGSQRVLVTDTEDVVIQYTKSGIKEQLFSPAFVNALSWLLASMLAGPVMKGDSGAKMGSECLKLYEDAYRKAALEDNKQMRDPIHYTPLGLEDYQNGLHS